MKNTFQVPTCTCLRCGHHWIIRKPGRPVQCPKCKSARWDQQREGEKQAK